MRPTSYRVPKVQARRGPNCPETFGVQFRAGSPITGHRHLYVSGVLTHRAPEPCLRREGRPVWETSSSGIRYGREGWVRMVVRKLKLLCMLLHCTRVQSGSSDSTGHNQWQLTDFTWNCVMVIHHCHTECNTRSINCHNVRNTCINGPWSRNLAEKAAGLTHRFNIAGAVRPSVSPLTIRAAGLNLQFWDRLSARYTLGYSEPTITVTGCRSVCNVCSKFRGFSFLPHTKIVHRTFREYI